LAALGDDRSDKLGCQLTQAVLLRLNRQVAEDVQDQWHEYPKKDCHAILHARRLGMRAAKKVLNHAQSSRPPDRAIFKKQLKLAVGSTTTALRPELTDVGSGKLHMERLWCIIPF
jgi:hypothetical protein